MTASGCQWILSRIVSSSKTYIRAAALPGKSGTTTRSRHPHTPAWPSSTIARRRAIQMLQLNFPDTAGPLKVLCVGAHSDDIEIGCGGLILSLIKSGRRLDVTWVVFSAPG